jgi:O-acetyl-ADP-ribose deacetylase (regulator of RNase III)
MTNKKRNVSAVSIITGVYHFPKDLAAKIAIKEVVDFLSQDGLY